MEWLIAERKRDSKLPTLVREAVRLFVEAGIEGTTTRQIAKAADISEATIYRHFKSKEAMAYSVFLTHLDAFTRELEKSAAPFARTRDKLRAIIGCYFSFFESERTLFDYVLASEHRELRKYPATKRQPFNVVVDLLKEGVKNKELRAQNVMFSAAYVIGMVHRVSVFRSYGRIGESLVPHVDEVTDACWRVLSGTGGKSPAHA